MNPPSAAHVPFEPPAAGPWWLRPAQLFDGTRMRTGVAFRVESGHITEMTEAFEPRADRAPVWESECIACPTFVDLQVNGGGGVLFNNEPTPESLAAIAAAHRKGGTGAWLPTLLTTTPDVMARAVDAVLAVYGQHGVVGMHIEGPHISPDFRGAHALEYIRPLDDHTWTLLRRLRTRDVPVILTLAPERLPPGALAELAGLGVKVSIGHSGATESQTREALAGGATLVTHLFNGMPALRTKQVGLPGVALDSPAWCGIIADGHHVADTMLRLAVRAKQGPGMLFAVTDAMPTVHGPAEFQLYGNTLRLHEGRLIDARGSLAGVHIDMIGTLRRLARNVELPLEVALAMVTSGPARAAGLQSQCGFLAVNAPASFLLLDPGHLHIRHLLLSGLPQAI
ncbi:MAG TPA: N-acetylglucosamine-6-phosphate deacetylase [Steroidobacteraceae bacterium]|nr:N-acetylglucosamine-6-phosphate deacetylase [Steroidobacteraceae bacterium]